MAKDVADAFRRSEDCLPVEELVLLLEGDRGESERQRCETHLAHCSHCSTEIALLHRFESAQPADEEREAVALIAARLRRDSPAKPEPWWRLLWRARILTPASIALAAAAIVLFVQVQRAPNSAEPSAKVGDVTRSASIQVIGPLGDVPQVPSELKWQATPGAGRYQVHVFEVDRTELWSATTSGTVLELPSSVTAKLTPSKKVLWEVTSFDGAGKSISSSGLRSFRVVRPQ